MTTKHSPLPWTAITFAVYDKDSRNIAHTGGTLARTGDGIAEQEANAAFIAKACSMHAELVEFADQVAKTVRFFRAGECSAKQFAAEIGALVDDLKGGV